MWGVTDSLEGVLYPVNEKLKVSHFSHFVPEIDREPRPTHTNQTARRCLRRTPPAHRPVPLMAKQSAGSKELPDTRNVGHKKPVPIRVLLEDSSLKKQDRSLRSTSQ
jgi:hypothetical protein